MDTDIERAAGVLIYKHGRSAWARADARYHALLAESATAASFWRDIRDYIATASEDPAGRQRLRALAHADPVLHLSGSHNGPIQRL